MQQIKEHAKNLVSTKKGMKVIAGTTAVIVAPKKMCFSVFLESFMDTLPSSDAVDQIEIKDIDKLKMIHMCAHLSKVIYNTNRSFPEDAGKIIFDSGEIIASDGIPFVVLNSDSMNSIFIVCRGSTSFSDWLIDFTASPADFSGGLVHVGMYKAALSLCTQLKDFLLKVSKENGNRKVIFTGHSLGGGVAAICNFIFRDEIPELNTESYVFGAPAVFSRDLWEKSRSFCTAFFIFGDPVPFLSFHNAASISSDKLPDVISTKIERAYQKNISYSSCCYQVDMKTNPFLQPPPPLSEILNDNAQFNRRNSALYPPGIQYIFRISDGLFGKLELHTTRNCDYFGHFIKELDEKVHAIRNYFDCVQELCKMANLVFEEDAELKQCSEQE